MESKKQIFKKASTTYYYSSIFFPPDVKEDVFALYAYVRYADDLIDQTPPDIKAFNRFKSDTKKALSGKTLNNHIIDDFAAFVNRRQCNPKWIWSFLDSMEADTKKKVYDTYEELQEYMYGSAEVIGLFMSKIFNLPDEALPYAQAQGEAMQLINFIRDIAEDFELGRQYIPTKDIKRFKTSIPPIKENYDEFVKLVRFEIERYKKIQKKAEKGYRYINKRSLIMVKTSAQMYLWTAKQIEKNPMIIFEKKVKPPKWYVILTALKNAII